MKREEYIWCLILIFACIGVMTLNGLGFQLVLYMHGDPLMEWWRVALWGLSFGGLLSIAGLTYVFTMSKGEKTCCSKSLEVIQ